MDSLNIKECTNMSSKIEEGESDEEIDLPVWMHKATSGYVRGCCCFVEFIGWCEWQQN